MDPQTQRYITSLVQAARDVLEFVSDPGEQPVAYGTIDAVYRPAKSEAQIAREKADRLERQSRVVRRLRRELGNWVDWRSNETPPPARGGAAGEG